MLFITITNSVCFKKKFYRCVFLYTRKMKRVVHLIVTTFLCMVNVMHSQTPETPFYNSNVTCEGYKIFNNCTNAVNLNSTSELQFYDYNHDLNTTILPQQTLSTCFNTSIAFPTAYTTVTNDFNFENITSIVILCAQNSNITSGQYTETSQSRLPILHPPPGYATSCSCKTSSADLNDKTCTCNTHISSAIVVSPFLSSSFMMCCYTLMAFLIQL